MLRLFHVVVLCQVIPDVGRVEEELVVIAYSALWPVPDVTVTAPTVIEVCVGVPLTAGVVTVAPVPLATSLTVALPVTATAAVAPDIFAAGIKVAAVIVAMLVVWVVGVPLILTLTTVLLYLDIVPAVNPAGSPDTAKLDDVMLEAYVPLLNV